MKATETKSTVLLHHHLKALRLPTVAAECEKVATQAAADNADHLSYLLRLTELELLEREKRSAERRIKFARFPTIKTLETFDFASRPSVNKVLIAELMRCEYIEGKENILMVGNPPQGSVRQIGSARPRRTWLRARVQGRIRVALRRHLHGL
jgi:DNA replication protein DnaC